MIPSATNHNAPSWSFQSKGRRPHAASSDRARFTENNSTEYVIYHNVFPVGVKDEFDMQHNCVLLPYTYRHFHSAIDILLVVEEQNIMF